MGRIMNTSDKARDCKSLYSRRPDCKSARTEALKHLRRLLLIITGTLVCLILFFVSSEWTCPALWGSHSLGNNLYAIDWKNNVQEIVYDEDTHGRTCYSGLNIIPNDVNADGDWILLTRFDKKWIIAKTRDERNSMTKFYILDKSFLEKGSIGRDFIHNYYNSIKDSVSHKEFYIYLEQNLFFSFTDSIAFANECEKRGIKLKWKKK